MGLLQNFGSVGACLALFLLFVSIDLGSCTRVQFFGKPNYNEVEISKADEIYCYPIQKQKPTFFRPNPDPVHVSSVKTDKCIMLYSSNFCSASKYSNSFKLKEDNPIMDQQIGSYHVCSQEKGGGPDLDVDFYTLPDYEGDIAAKFTNVYSCRNLPPDVRGSSDRLLSVDNHGNDIEVFEGEHCKGRSQVVEAGRNPVSRSLSIFPVVLSVLNNLGFVYKDELVIYDILSFKPFGPLEGVKLTASIFKFEFTNGTMSGKLPLETENVKLAASTILRSNGSAKLVQEYTVASKVTENLEYTIATGFSNMHTVGVKAGYEASVKGGVPCFAEGTSKWSLELNYQYQRTDSGSTSNKTSTSKEESLSIRQMIEIPPCTECTVSSYVKKVKDFPIAYKAYSRVHGTAANHTLSAEELRGYIAPGAEYVRDYDKHAIEIAVEGTMFAEYGLNTFINADCVPIRGCLTNPPSVGPGKSTHFIIEQPIVSKREGI